MRKGMKINKGILLLLILTMILGGTTAYAGTDSKKTEFPRTPFLGVKVDKYNEVTPMSGTGYTSGYFSVSDSDWVRVAGHRMPAKIEVNVIKGYFLRGMGSYKTVLYMDGAYNNQGIYVSTSGCDIVNTPSWQAHNNYSRFTSLAQVKGDGSMTETKTMSLEATIELAVKAGVEVEIPGFGSASTEAEVREAFTGSTSKTVTYTVSTAYNKYHGLELTVTGMGRIDLTVE